MKRGDGLVWKKKEPKAGKALLARSQVGENTLTESKGKKGMKKGERTTEEKLTERKQHP